MSLERLVGLVKLNDERLAFVAGLGEDDVHEPVRRIRRVVPRVQRRAQHGRQDPRGQRLARAGVAVHEEDAAVPVRPDVIKHQGRDLAGAGTLGAWIATCRIVTWRGRSALPMFSSTSMTFGSGLAPSSNRRCGVRQRCTLRTGSAFVQIPPLH